MMRKKKKRGSSLALVLVIFLLLTITGTALITLTSTTYKSKIVQSKRVKNLYESESGLDITANTLAKFVEGAIIVANKAVDEAFSDVDIISKEKKQIMDKNTPYYPRTTNPRESKLLKTNLTIDKDGVKEVQNQIFKEHFEAFIEKYISNMFTINDGITINNQSELQSYINSVYYDLNFIINPVYTGNINFSEIIINNTTAISNNKPIVRLNGSSTFTFNSGKCEIPLISQFYTLNSNDLTSKEQLREVAVTYTIETPNYNEDLSQSIESVLVPWHTILDNSISVDGDMVIGGDITILGDLFVKGKENNITLGDIVFDKYLGGIEITNNNPINGANIQGSTTGTKVIVDGNIVSPKSISIRKNSSLDVEGNLYSGNVHLGEKSSGDGENSKLTVASASNSVDGNVYLKNDLSVYAKYSNIDINKFYGLSDTSLNINGKEEKSSSIIVNANEHVDINIKEEAYILGTAYIKTVGQYATGESLAIKGNYLAYTMPINTPEFSNSTFKYDNPLQLVYDENGEPYMVDKQANYFIEYAKQNNETLIMGNDATKVKVKLPEKTVTSGAYVTMDKNNKGTATKTDINILASKSEEIEKNRKILAGKIYRMGINDLDESEILNPDSIKSVFDSTGKNKEQIILNNTARNKYIKLANGYNVLINNDENIKTIIKGKGSTYASGVSEKIIDCSSDGKVQGVIITKGDIEIYGEVDFEGTIIVGGDFKAYYDDSNKSFTYDKNIVKYVVGLYFDDFYNKNNFVNSDSNGITTDARIIKITDDYMRVLPKEKLEIGIEITQGANSQQLANKCIKQGIWNIVK